MGVALGIARLTNAQGASSLGLFKTPMIRKTTIFTGHVQGVGFRYTAQSIARDFTITGYVRNLDNGNVELVAEGDKDQIAQLLETIARKMTDYIKHRQDVDSPPTGEFRDFGIRR